MAQSSELMEGSIPPLAAQMLGQDLTTGLTAAGSTQGTALAIASGVNIVTTAAASTGVRLPPASAAPITLVHNGGANTLSVYPATGEIINNAAANAAFTLATGVTGIFVPSSPRWGAVRSA